MSGGVEDRRIHTDADSTDRDLGSGQHEVSTRPLHSGPETITHEYHHHHILIEPEEDRWGWRRKIRQNKRQLAVYRVDGRRPRTPS